jgi:hypothetical protein
VLGGPGPGLTSRAGASASRCPLLRRGDFASRDDPAAKITGVTIRYNKNARPYKWSYDADADHARYLLRHRQPELVPAPAEAA